jgi:hypothetical protein
MKKILLFLFLSCLSFSETCNWVSEPDSTLRKYISLLKKHSLVDKIYCDNNDKLMVYWRSNNSDDVDIGFILNNENAKTLDIDDIAKAFNSFGKKLTMFDEVKLSKKAGDSFPENLNIRLYMYDPNFKDTYMFFKITYNYSSNTAALYYNKEHLRYYEGFIEGVVESGNLYPTDDIIY